MSDHQEWHLELERVLPQLKVFVKADARDWRTHISQMETLKTNILENSDTAEAQLKKLHSEFTFDLEKIESREKHLNNELKPLIQQFKELSIELSSIQYAQNQLQEDMEKQTAELNEVMMEQELKKEEMERRGQAMSDGSEYGKVKRYWVTNEVYIPSFQKVTKNILMNTYISITMEFFKIIKSTDIPIDSKYGTFNTDTFQTLFALQ